MKGRDGHLERALFMQGTGTAPCGNEASCSAALHGYTCLTTDKPPPAIQETRRVDLLTIEWPRNLWWTCALYVSMCASWRVSHESRGCLNEEYSREAVADEGWGVAVCEDQSSAAPARRIERRLPPQPCAVLLFTAAFVRVRTSRQFDLLSLRRRRTWEWGSVHQETLRFARGPAPPIQGHARHRTCTCPSTHSLGRKNACVLLGRFRCIRAPISMRLQRKLLFLVLGRVRHTSFARRHGCLLSCFQGGLTTRP